MSTTKGKVCAKCGKRKAESQFDRNSTARDGLQSVCKECRLAYRKKNSAILAAKQKKYYEENREHCLEVMKKRAESKKEMLREYKRNYYIKNHEKAKEYRSNNLDRIKANNRRYQQELTDAVVARDFVKNTKLKRADIPPKLIEAQRLHRLILRQLTK